MVPPVVVLAIAATGTVQVFNLPPAPPPPNPPGDHSRPPVPLDRPSWATFGDYPVEMLRQVPRGRVYALLDISADGRVTACTVEYGSGSPAIDETTCHLLTTRARFRPALDKSGAPTTARFGQTVSWRLDQPNQQ